MQRSKTIADQAREHGKLIHEATTANRETALNVAIGQSLPVPFSASPGRLVDASGAVTERFACVVHTNKLADEEIAADGVAAVIDLVEELGVEELRIAHARVLATKRLEKTEVPDKLGRPVATVTMTLIYAHRATCAIETITDELQRLNEKLPHYEWVDMVAISDVAVVSYGCQLAGQFSLGGMLPPAKGAHGLYSPAWYIIPTMQASREGTFNKAVAFIVSYLKFCSPDVVIPNFNDYLEGVSKTVVTSWGYQYNLAGELRPVPREHYADRLLPARPFVIETRGNKEFLAALQHVPWQDGGVVLLKGKLPLEGLLVFLGKDALHKGGVIRTGPDTQASYVMPIAPTDFIQMVTRLRNQSNMIVRQHAPKFVMEKMADEGTTTPFMARTFLGLLKIREMAFDNKEERLSIDKLLDQALSPLLAARTTAREIEAVWNSHAAKIHAGEDFTFDGTSIQVDGNAYRSLRKGVDSFIYDAAKACKEGAQKVAKSVGINIGFLFRDQGAYNTGMAALHKSDPTLASYIDQTRSAWSERLILARNNIDHEGWALPRLQYKQTQNGVTVQQPEIDGMPAIDFVNFMLDRVTCFVEEFIVYCFETRLPEGVTLTEISLPDRVAEAPERFRLTLKDGGLPAWQLRYSAEKFEKN